MRTFQSALLVVVVGLAACKEPLDVTNVNNPDRDRVLAKPLDVEVLIGQLYQNFINATIGGSNNGLQPQLLTSGMESYSGNANFQMGPRGAIPRGSPHVPNGRGNPGEEGNLRDFQRLSVTARTAADALKRLSAPGFTIATPARDARALAFGQFVLGLSLGHLALVYDSAAIVRPTDSLPSGILTLDDIRTLLPLAGYSTVMGAGIAYLDSAIATVNANSTGFPLPATWINGNPLTSAQFIQVVRSYRAKLRAGVARTPAARAAVDWNAVIADATFGITANLNVRMDAAAGWDVVWVIQHYLFQSWTQMWQFMVGFAADQASFDAWLGTAVANRTPFLVVTPDRRFPVGATRAAQQAASGCTSTGCAPPTGNLYFRNRDGAQDIAGISLAFSFYDFYRFQSFFDAQRIGNYPVMAKAEIDLLAAEGYIRTGQFAQATALIDITRVGRGILPSVAGIANLTTPVPGGASCVPRIPVGPNFTSSACGNLFEALKWEKRMETAYIGYGSWYFDSRGWGDLPEGTALHWPVPWQELDSRFETLYDMPATSGTLPGAARGTYGL